MIKKKGAYWHIFIPDEPPYQRTIDLEFGQSISRNASFNFIEFDAKELPTFDVFICGLCCV